MFDRARCRSTSMRSTTARKRQGLIVHAANRLAGVERSRGAHFR